MKEKIDIVIMDYAREVVTFVKVDPEDVEKFDGDLERYIAEFLEFDLDNIQWMSGTGICVEMFGGIPNCGLQVTAEDYWDAQD